MEILAMAVSERAEDRRAPALLDRLVGFRDSAYRLALHILGSQAPAEDAVQQAYLEVMTQLRSGPPPDDERAWFLRAVANTAKDRLRRESRLKTREVSVGINQAHGTLRSNLESELVGALRAVLASLEPKYRLPLALCYQEDMTQHQAATVLDMPERTVSDHVNVGLAKLRKALERAGYPAAVAAVLGGLKQTAPAVPASLGARVEALVAKGTAVQASTDGGAASAAASAAKGGMSMKIIAGVVLAGAVAAGVAVSVSGRGGGAAPAAAPGAPGEYRWPEPDIPIGPCIGEEHVAFLRTKISYGLDGPAMAALRGWQHCGLAFGPKGEIYAFCPANSVLWEIAPDGGARIIAGDGVRGCRDGPADQARFDIGFGGYSWFSVGCDGAGNVYLDDSANGRVRKIFRKPDGNWHVETFRGLGKGARRPKTPGQEMPVEEIKYFPGSLAVFKDGSLSFCDYSAGPVVVSPDGKAELLGLVPPRDPKSPNPGYAVSFPPDDPDGIYFFCGRDGNQRLFRYDRKRKKFDHLFGASFQTAAREGHLWSGSPATKVRTHTTGCMLSPNGSVAMTGGGDELSMRRICRGVVKYVMAEGPDQVVKGGKVKDPPGSLWGGNLKGLDSQGRVYLSRGRYAWGTWITRLVFAKEE